MNTVAEIGRLTKDVELKQTPNGKTYGRFTLAVNRRYKNSNGTYDADYFNCVVWGLTAENLAKFTKKGSLIGVSGMLQSRSYEKDGNRVYVTEILVESFDLLEKKDKGSEVVPVFETVDIKDDDLPF